MKNLLFLLSLFFGLQGFSQDKMELFFDFNKEIPNETSISKLIQWMSAHKEAKILKIEGYCDSIDDSAYNKKLSSMRIDAVLKIFNENAIAISKNIEIQSLGKDFKQLPIQSENRKVVFYYEMEKKEENLATKVKSSKKGDLIKLKNLYFFNNSDKIRPISEPILNELLSVMNQNPKLKIEIQGHVCCGQVGALEVISSSRAKAVYDFLLKNTIQKERMSFKGFGFSKPIHPIPEKNTQEEDENRRVEIMILEN